MEKSAGQHRKGGCLSALFTVAVAIVGVVLVSVLGGCGDSFRDLEGVKGQDPEKVQIIYNVDGFPNVVRLCIDKVAFATTTRQDESAIFRVPEWDVAFCGATK